LHRKGSFHIRAAAVKTHRRAREKGG
jgi:hypothetical protein